MVRVSVLLGCLLAAAAAAAAPPGRHLRYAESSSRLVYAFVFGSQDTCRVISRPRPPRLGLETLLRRPPGAGWRGESDETLVVEFRFGRSGRPVHIVPGDDARFLVGFANRAPDGSAPRQDRIHHLRDGGRPEPLAYDALLSEPAPRWPEFDRALFYRRKPEPAAPSTLSYAFLTRQTAPGRLLVARQSEDGEGYVTELVCFAVDLDAGRAALPEPDELARLVAGKGAELWRGGAAWALGCRGSRVSLAGLKTALGRARSDAPRAAVARAIVRCGDAGARKTLRGLLAAGNELSARRNAARALAQLPPDRRDVDALAGALVDGDAETAHLAAVALARLGPKAVNALLRVSRSSRPPRRAAAARVLARIDDAGAERRLLALVRDAEEVVQTAAAVALTAPPRAIMPQNHADFGRALSACGKSRNRKAARRLSLLAYHARIHHEAVYQGLVACAELEPKAIWALRKLTGEDLETAEDCRRWWKQRK